MSVEYDCKKGLFSVGVIESAPKGYPFGGDRIEASSLSETRYIVK
jgi:hypothetical protein